MYDLYASNKRDTCRYVLGKEGKRKLFVVGLNPSTANREKSDTTVAKVERVAISQGYDGFVMTNLYPLRSTDPKELPIRGRASLLRDNLEAIQKLAAREAAPTFWAAWGVNIETRTYLSRALLGFSGLVQEVGGRWVHYGALSKEGHPRHPSRLAYSWDFHPFKVDPYLDHYG